MPQRTTTDQGSVKCSLPTPLSVHGKCSGNSSIQNPHTDEHPAGVMKGHSSLALLCPHCDRAPRGRGRREKRTAGLRPSTLHRLPAQQRIFAVEVHGCLFSNLSVASAAAISFHDGARKACKQEGHEPDGAWIDS